MAHIPQAIADYITLQLIFLGYFVNQGNVFSNIIALLTIIVLLIRGCYYVWKWDKDLKQHKKNDKKDGESV